MSVSPSTSLFVGDLPKICTEYDLEQLFSPYGPILDVHLKRNAAVPYGFLTLSNIQAAEAAIRDMNGMMYMGRQIRYVLSEMALEYVLNVPRLPSLMLITMLPYSF